MKKYPFLKLLEVMQILRLWLKRPIFLSNVLVTEDAKLTVLLNNNLSSQLKAVDAIDCDADFHTLSFTIVLCILFRHKRFLQTMLML